MYTNQYKMDYSKSYQTTSFTDEPVPDTDLIEEHNERLWAYRGIDAGPQLRSTLSGRPQFTKYSLFHVFDKTNEPAIIGTVVPDLEGPFHPSAQHAQSSLFKQTIDIESQLQNRGLLALQRGNPGTFVPGPAPANMYTSANLVQMDGPSKTSMQTAGTEFAREYGQHQIKTQGRGGLDRMFEIQTRTK